MKICIPSYGPTINSRPQPVFGRCEYFSFVDLDTMAFESVRNKDASDLDDCGRLSAQIAVDRGASVIITDHIGPKAQAVLNDANVKVQRLPGHSVQEVVANYNNL